MILIEVIFGAINGNPISVDDALDTTSTNPVENRVVAAAIAAINNALNHVQDELDEKEVVSYSTKTAIDTYIQTLLDEGTTAEIEAAKDKLYYAEDTNILYKFDGKELHAIDTEYIIISGNTTARDNALKPYVTSGAHKVIWINGSTTTFYTFTVEATSTKVTQTLIYRDGWMRRICSNPTATTPTWPSWTSKKYSYVGHTHTAANITDLTTGLQTTAQTVAGAINEVLALATATFHAFTIDFGDEREEVHQKAVGGAFTITKISTGNVASLELKINGVTQTTTLTDGVFTGTIQVPADASLIWKIGRTTGGEIAEINVKFNY